MSFTKCNYCVNSKGLIYIDFRTSKETFIHNDMFISRGVSGKDVNRIYTAGYTYISIRI
jgi:hypothetical protein